MARTTNAIATEEDIEYAITNNLLLAKLSLPEYTKRGITKERLVNIAYVDESSINSLSDKQLVRWDLIESGFFTTMPLSTTVGKNSATYTYKIASKYGWSSSENASWVSISPSTSLSSGVKSFDVVVSQKTTSGTRSTTITFTESTTNKTIEISLTQNGNKF